MDDILTTARQSLEWDEGHHFIVEECCNEIERLRAALREIADGPPEGMTEKRWLEQVRTLAWDSLLPRVVEQNAGKTEGK